MPVFNTPAKYLEAAILSVINQNKDNWELIICDDASSNEECLTILKKYDGYKDKIKVVSNASQSGICISSNLAVQNSKGQYLSFIDHDDTIEEITVEELNKALTNNPNLEFIYTDEDKLNLNEESVEKNYKPDFSYDHLRSVMYIMHLITIERKFFYRIGGFREEFNGAQDYDLALRATSQTKNVFHIKKILYHWRMIPGSAAADVNAKPWALINARKALEETLKNDEIPGYCEDGLIHGTFRARYPISKDKIVTLVIFTNGSTRTLLDGRNINLIANFVESIKNKSTFKKYKINIISNGNLPDEVNHQLTKFECEIFDYSYQGEFSFANKFNYSLETVKTNDVIFLNDDLEVISPDWIESLIEFSQLKRVGAVGAKLLFENGNIQHAGMVTGVNGIVGHIFYNNRSDLIGYESYTHLIKNYSCITGAVLATRMDVVREIGGFDESLKIDFNDVDFCLKIRQQGLDIVFTPYSQLYHFEKSTAKRERSNDDEVNIFFNRWDKIIRDDPFYNSLLPKDPTQVNSILIN
jgi:glycosyltransferase involved in cell wall biosynthesis